MVVIIQKKLIKLIEQLFVFVFIEKKPIVYNIKGLNFSIFSILVSQIYFVQSSV